MMIQPHEVKPVFRDEEPDRNKKRRVLALLALFAVFATGAFLFRSAYDRSDQWFGKTINIKSSEYNRARNLWHGTGIKNYEIRISKTCMVMGISGGNSVDEPGDNMSNDDGPYACNLISIIEVRGRQARLAGFELQPLPQPRQQGEAIKTLPAVPTDPPWLESYTVDGLFREVELLLDRKSGYVENLLGMTVDVERGYAELRELDSEVQFDPVFGYPNKIVAKGVVYTMGGFDSVGYVFDEKTEVVKLTKLD